METIFEDSDVEIDDISILKRTAIRNSVADDFVNWCAEGFGEFVVV
jgi:hypothetical protein